MHASLLWRRRPTRRLAPDVDAAARAGGSWLARLSHLLPVTRLLRAHRQRSGLRSLRALDDRLLVDIGVRREDLLLWELGGSSSVDDGGGIESDGGHRSPARRQTWRLSGTWTACCGLMTRAAHFALAQPAA
jgi:uncharacterized protein YjiS (DUF1127 family)